MQLTTHSPSPTASHTSPICSTSNVRFSITIHDFRPLSKTIPSSFGQDSKVAECLSWLLRRRWSGLKKCLLEEVEIEVRRIAKMDDESSLRGV